MDTKHDGRAISTLRTRRHEYLCALSDDAVLPDVLEAIRRLVCRTAQRNMMAPTLIVAWSVVYDYILYDMLVHVPVECIQEGVFKSI
jgi:hypothetical protein